MKDVPKKLLQSKYRKTMWRNAKAVVKKLSKVLPISEAYVMGSFTTKKSRPADVDFMLLLKTKKGTEENWSLDLVIAPDNKHGQEVVRDADLWVKEKYGLNKSTMLRIL